MSQNGSYIYVCALRSSKAAIKQVAIQASTLKAFKATISI